jgi:predicted negative regulator of RcsB-dependent stress response
MQSDTAQLNLVERLWDWFEVNRTPVLWSVAAVVVAGAGVGFFVWHAGARQANANDALSSVISHASATPQRLATPAALLKMASEYPNTDAAGRAVLFAAADLFAEGKYSEAQAQFEKSLRDFPNSPFLGQALLGVAASLEAQGKTNRALSAYQDIVQHHPTDNVVTPAKFGLARLYMAQGKLQQARDLLMELLRTSTFATINSEAGMRLQELFSKHPELEPKRPASSASSTPLRIGQP